MTAVLGIDIGGTTTKALLLDAPERRAEQPTRAGEPGAVVGGVFDLIDGFGAFEAAAIGVAVPGVVTDGVVRHSANLHLGSASLDLAGPLAKRYGLPVVVENDARSAAVGAAQVVQGRRPDAHVVAYLGLGTGVASGLVVDGVLQTGISGVAGEIGHAPLLADGPECPCGQRGCAESVVGGWAIARDWPGGGRALAGAARRGDAHAEAMLDRLAGHIARLVQWLVLATDPHVVAVGGGFIAAGDVLLDRLDAQFRQIASTSRFVDSLGLPGRVEVLDPGLDVGARGVAALAARAIGHNDNNEPNGGTR